MEGEDGGDMPPFWLQSSNSSNYNNRNRRRSTNFLTNSGFLIVILTIIALFLIFIVVPSFLSFTSQYIKPHLVKKNWDSLNIVLVFFAIICGFLSRRTADDIPAAAADNGFSNLSSQRALVEEDEPVQMHHHHHRHLRHRPMSMDQPWIGYSNVNPVMYNSMDNLSSLSSSNVRGMRRNSSSYPDLRQESLWSPASESRRFYDDINVDGYQYGGAPDYLHRRHPSDPLPAPVPTEYQYNESSYLLHHNSAPVPATVPESDDTKYFSDTKTIPVDTFVVRHQEEESPEPPPVIEPTEQPPPPSPKTPPPPPPPPAAETRRKERAERRTFRSVERREKPVEEKKEMEFEKVQTQTLIPPPSPPPPAPPPPPPQSSKPSKSDQKGSKSEKKRSSNAAKDIKNTFASLYNQRKNKKKNKQKSKESFDDMFHQMFDEPSSQSFVGPPPSPPPPPPPPPPPSSVFHQLFKKSSKTKKIHSDTSPPPPPPPPPAKPSRSSKRRVQNQDPSPSTPNISPPQQVRSPPKPEPSSRRKKPSTPGKPPLPASRSSNTYFPSDELYLNSGNQSPLIPMPPPPPPPPFKMSAMKFVVRGDFVRIRSRTWRSGSPELLDDAASAQESPMDTPISTPRVMDSTDGESSIPSSPFCPSPDVDYKADSFIARFRAGLKNGN